MSKNQPLFSSRALNTPPSPIRSLSKYARVAEEKGLEVLRANIGQPDIETPTDFLNAIKDYSEATLAYEVSEGNIDLRENWANYINRDLGSSLEANNFLITTGASEALIFSFMVCCDPGSEVIVFEPTYANYMSFAAIAGINLVPIGTKLEENFSLPDSDRISDRLTANTRAILLCNPNNPTGTIYSKAEVEMLLEICEENNLFLIVDETYRDIVFDDIPFFSVLDSSIKSNRVVVIDSLSKRFSLCGARLGCLISHNLEFLEKTLSLAQARLASPTLSQFAAAKMLSTLSSDYTKNICKEFQARRDVLYKGLSSLSGCEIVKSQGAFYSMLKLPVDDATEFVKFMLTDFSLDQQTVFLAPAKGFYISSTKGKDIVRIAAVIKQDKLARIPVLIKAALEEYKK